MRPTILIELLTSWGHQLPRSASPSASAAIIKQQNRTNWFWPFAEAFDSAMYRALLGVAAASPRVCPARGQCQSRWRRSSNRSVATTTTVSTVSVGAAAASGSRWIWMDCPLISISQPSVDADWKRRQTEINNLRISMSKNCDKINAFIAQLCDSSKCPWYLDYFITQQTKINAAYA